MKIFTLDVAWVVWLGYLGGASGVAGLVIQTLEAVRMSERRPLRPVLTAAGGICSACAAVAGVIAAACLTAILDRGMLPVAAIASAALGAFYAHGIHALLRQRSIARPWRAFFTVTSGTALAFGMLDLWVTTTALVIWH
jgi:hypothetical protein